MYLPLPDGVEYPWVAPEEAELAERVVLASTVASLDVEHALWRAISVAELRGEVTQLEDQLSSCAAIRPEVSYHRPRRVNVNTASQRALERLPRIGPAMAERIIADRPFSSVSDLERVRGIGPTTLDRLRPLVTVRE